MKTLMRVSLNEACEICGLSIEKVNHFIEEEWIVPMDQEQMLLDDEDIHRLKLISDLIDVLGVNEEAVPVILHLIDQIHVIKTYRQDNG